MAIDQLHRAGTGRDESMSCVVQKTGASATALRVLIVDDDDFDAELVARSIARKGMPAVMERAPNARRALERLRCESFDVMLLDYTMPGCNGVEMLAALRRDSSAANLAVVMMSHSADEDLAVRCIEAGAQDFILKSEVNGARLQRAILHARTRASLTAPPRSASSNTWRRPMRSRGWRTATSSTRCCKWR